MVKILCYIDRKDKEGFSRTNKEKTDKKEERIYAEVEMDEMLKDGWKLLSATTSEFVAGAFTATTSFARLTVIFHKED